MGYRAQVVIAAVITEILHTHTHILRSPRRQPCALGSAGDDPKPVTHLARHVIVPSMRAARPSGTMCPIIRATETGSDRFRSYPQARRPLVSGYVPPCSPVIATLVS